MIYSLTAYVHISTLDNDYYQFDAAKQRLIGENSGIDLSSWAINVKIRVVAVPSRTKNGRFQFSRKCQKTTSSGKNSETKSKKSL